MMSIPLSRYTTLCILSTILALCTIALLLFSSTGDKTDNNYIYLSLAAPTFALAHHLFYFVAPFERWAVAGLEDEKVEYHIVHEAPPAYSSQNNDSQNNTQNSNQNIDQNASNSLTSRKVYVHATRQPISNTYNPLASSTLNILTLVLLAVCIGALALSTGTVAFIDTLDALAAEKQGELEQRMGNGTHMGFGLGVMPLDCYSGVLPVETSVVEAIPQVTGVPEVEAVEEEKEETPVEEYTPVDPSAPPRPILFYQATLSFLQTIALGYMALTAMRIRTLHYNGDGSYAWAEDELEELGGEVVFEEEEEEDWEVQWVRASEDSRDEEDKQL